MKFTEPNVKTDNYLENFKPFQLKAVAVSAGGYEAGFSEPFLGLLDSGAKNASISSKRMNAILEDVRDKDGKPLQLYILPHFYLGKIHFEDLVVTVPESNNFDCLIGRSILHQCISTYDPLTDMVHFDFDPRLQQNKQTILA
jgi:hypothetical protein